MTETERSLKILEAVDGMIGAFPRKRGRTGQATPEVRPGLRHSVTIPNAENDK